MEEDGRDVESQGWDGVGTFKISGQVDHELDILAGQMILQFQVESELSIDVIAELCFWDIKIDHF